MTQISENKKRILIFSTAHHPFVGGAEVAVKEITDRLPAVSFVMITARLDPALKEYERIGQIDVYRIGKGNKWDKLRLVFQGWKKADTLGTFDVVWSIMASYGGFAALRFKKKHPNTPYMLTLQEGDTKAHIYSRVWFVWPWFKRIFTKANRIQAISTYLAGWAKDMGTTCHIEVVPNGVDIEGFGLRTTDYGLGEFRKKMEIPKEATVVVSVSRLVKKNGIVDLVRAMQFLPDTIHLLLAGEGELKQPLQTLVKEKGLATRVHVIGSIPYKEVPEYLAIADVFVRPSLSEGLGNAFLEAMAMEVPVVGTAVGGIPDFLSDGETGWFCKVKDPKSIAEKILYILDEKHREEVVRVIANARKMVEEKYSWDFIVQQMNIMFHSL